MLRKYFFAVSIFLMLFYKLFAEDVYFKTTQNTPIWEHSNDRIIFELPRGTLVVADSGVMYDPNFARDQTPFQIFIWNDKRYATYIEALVPAETEDFFAEGLISDIVSPEKKQLIFEYYAQALAQGNRNVIRDRDTLFWQWFDKQPRFNPYDNNKEWYFFLYTVEHNFLIFQTALRLESWPYYNLNFLIKNIKKKSNDYYVTVKMYQSSDPRDFLDPANPPWANSPIAKIPVPSQREFFDLIIVPDGDYLDVYVDNYDTYFATFVYVDNQFLQELDTLIRTGTCNDLSHIVWPRRADGSMDYSLPTLSTQQEEKQLEPIDFSADSSDTENQQTAQNSAKTSAMPFWAWFAIIGGAVVIAGGVVFVVKLRK